MTTVVLRPELSETLQSDARGSNKTLTELVNEVVERYLHMRQQEKLDQEIAAYTALHPHLLTTYPGQWVAIHNQNVVDHDVDGAVLYRRIRIKYGRTSVLIRQIKAHPVDEIWVRTPSTGKLPA